MLCISYIILGIRYIQVLYMIYLPPFRPSTNYAVSNSGGISSCPVCSRSVYNVYAFLFHKSKLGCAWCEKFQGTCTSYLNTSLLRVTRNAWYRSFLSCVVIWCKIVFRRLCCEPGTLMILFISIALK